MEIITLIGGPADGHRIGWRGGDVFKLAPTPRLDFSVQTVEPFSRDDHIYRRSLNTTNLFVYQP